MPCDALRCPEPAEGSPLRSAKFVTSSNILLLSLFALLEYTTRSAKFVTSSNILLLSLFALRSAKFVTRSAKFVTSSNILLLSLFALLEYTTRSAKFVTSSNILLLSLFASKITHLIFALHIPPLGEVCNFVEYTTALTFCFKNHSSYFCIAYPITSKKSISPVLSHYFGISTLQLASAQSPSKPTRQTNPSTHQPINP